MNKILISILFVAMLIGCTKQKSYTLIGTAESADLNGTLVRLDIFEGEEWVSLETIIENQTFTFEGVVEKPIMAYLLFRHPNPEKFIHPKTFILENTNIKFEITENLRVKVSGSRANDLIQVFATEYDNLLPQEFVDSVQSELLTEAEWHPRFTQYIEKRQQLAYDFSKKHVNTLPGTAVFIDNRFLFSIEQRVTVFDLMNEATKNNSDIQNLIESTEAQQQVAAGQPFIDFTLPTPTGEMLSLSDVVGNHDYVLLHFWASWCGPCIGFFPELTEFYREHAGKSFEIFSVSLDGDKENWENAIEEFVLTWHHVSDLKIWDCEVRKLYGVNGITHYTLIDRNGIIVGGRELSLDDIAELLQN